MTTSSLFKEIESLNKDIDSCKDRLDNNASKRNVCPPNCYCDKRQGMDNRNLLISTRKKTASASVTKTDITPRCYQEREISSKSKSNLKKSLQRPKTASDDAYFENDFIEYQCCPRLKANTISPANVRCSKEEKYSCVENSAEPVKLPKKVARIRNEPSWSTILQQNNKRDMKENINYNIIPKKEYIQVNSSPSCSGMSSVTLETQPIYMKNKGIQCEEKAISQEKFVHSSGGPLNTIQYLIMNMKSKLKGTSDPYLGSMLDEMEVALRKVPLDRGDSQAMGDTPRARRTSSIEKYLHPRPDFKQQQKMQTSREMLEATYLELEATCAKLKKERDSAIERASQKSAELVESMKREVETKTKLNETNKQIKEMSAKLETYTKSMEGLTEHMKKLQNENKDVERIRGQVAQLSTMMRDVTQENKSLLAELQLLTIERNQLEVALAVKEQDLEKKTKELENLSQLLLESSKGTRLSLEKNRKHQSSAALNALNSFNTHPSRNESARSPQLVASSPNSSSSESMLRARLDSWIAFSAITPSDKITEKSNLPSANNQSRTKNESVKIGDNSCSDHQPTPPNIQPIQTSATSVEKRPDLNKIEKLKEEIRRMFSEMRELAKDVPPVPVVEFSTVGDSSDMNWSEMSNTVNSYESISDFQSSEFNEFLNHNQVNY